MARKNVKSTRKVRRRFASRANKTHKRNTRLKSARGGIRL